MRANPQKPGLFKNELTPADREQAFRETAEYLMHKPEVVFFIFVGGLLASHFPLPSASETPAPEMMLFAQGLTDLILDEKNQDIFHQASGLKNWCAIVSEHKSSEKKDQLFSTKNKHFVAGMLHTVSQNLFSFQKNTQKMRQLLSKWYVHIRSIHDAGTGGAEAEAQLFLENIRNVGAALYQKICDVPDKALVKRSIDMHAFQAYFAKAADGIESEQVKQWASLQENYEKTREIKGRTVGPIIAFLVVLARLANSGSFERNFNRGLQLIGKQFDVDDLPVSHPGFRDLLFYVCAALFLLGIAKMISRTVIVADKDVVHTLQQNNAEALTQTLSLEIKWRSITAVLEHKGEITSVGDFDLDLRTKRYPTLQLAPTQSNSGEKKDEKRTEKKPAKLTSHLWQIKKETAPFGTEVQLADKPDLLSAVIAADAKVPDDRTQEFQAGLEKGIKNRGPGIEILDATEIHGYKIARLASTGNQKDGCLGFIETYPSEHRRRFVFHVYVADRHKTYQRKDLEDLLKHYVDAHIAEKESAAYRPSD